MCRPIERINGLLNQLEHAYKLDHQKANAFKEDEDKCLVEAEPPKGPKVHHCDGDKED